MDIFIPHVNTSKIKCYLLFETGSFLSNSSFFFFFFVSFNGALTLFNLDPGIIFVPCISYFLHPAYIQVVPNTVICSFEIIVITFTSFPLPLSLWLFSLLMRFLLLPLFSSVQSLSRVQLFATMDCSLPGFPVHHQLPEHTQTHVLCISDAIQPSHPLSSPSPSTFNLSQHHGLFKWVSSLHQVAKVLEFQLQHPLPGFASSPWFKSRAVFKAQAKFQPLLQVFMDFPFSEHW